MMESKYVNNDKKRIFIGLGIIFIVVLLTYKLPDKSYSILGYLIKPINIKDNTVNISGFIPIILIVVSTNILAKVEKVKGINTSIIFIVILIIVMPIMNWTIEITRTGYHSLKDEGISSVEIMDTRSVLNITDDRAMINLSLKIKNYSTNNKSIKVRTYFPEDLVEIVNKSYYESDTSHNIPGKRKKREIEEIVSFELKSEEAKDKLLKYWRSGIEFEYELY